MAATPAQAEVKVRLRWEKIGASFILTLFFLQQAALQYEGHNHFIEFLD